MQEGVGTPKRNIGDTVNRDPHRGLPLPMPLQNTPIAMLNVLQDMDSNQHKCSHHDTNLEHESEDK